MFRIISFIAVCFLAFSAPLPLFFLAVAVYCFYYVGYELLFVSILADAYYLNVTHLSAFPIHTLGLAGVLVLHAIVRPYITL